MLPIAEFEKRFAGILDALDAAAARADDADLEELCAEYEDALFLLSEIDPGSEGAAEEFLDTLEEFEALGQDCARFPAAKDSAAQLATLVERARNAATAER